MLKTSITLNIALIIMFLLSSFNHIEATQTEKEEIIEVFIYPTQIVKGETREIYFEGENITEILDVEITPPENISVTEIKQGLLTEEEEKKGTKRWIIQFQVDKDAQTVPRSVVLVTRQGRSKPVSVDIIIFPPRISNLNISSTMSGSSVEFKFEVFDEAGDVDTNPSVYAVVSCGLLGTIKPSRVIAILGGSSFLKAVSDLKIDNFNTKGGPGWCFIVGSCTQVEKKDEQNSIMSGEISLGSTKASGVCMLSILIMDKNGYMSNNLEAAVEFN